MAVPDQAILDSQRDLAREGLWVEPASAAGLAGLRHAVKGGLKLAGKLVVCVCTGHGLKDPDWAIAGAPQPKVVPADAAACAAELGL